MTYFSFPHIIIAAVTMCTGLVNAQTGNGLHVSDIVTIVGGSLMALFCICIMVYACVKGYIYYKHIEEQSMPQRVQLPSTTNSHPLQPCPEPSYSSSEAASTFTGVPHSTVPLESELQNVPPPDYSTAHQYPLCTQPGETALQNMTYDEENFKEPPPPYPNPPQ